MGGKGREGGERWSEGQRRKGIKSGLYKTHCHTHKSLLRQLLRLPKEIQVLRGSKTL